MVKLKRGTHTAYSEASSLRLRAAWLYYNEGLTQKDVANNLLVSLSSSGQVMPNFWVNPRNGVSYLVAVVGE